MKLSVLIAAPLITALLSAAAWAAPGPYHHAHPHGLNAMVASAARVSPRRVTLTAKLRVTAVRTSYRFQYSRVTRFHATGAARTNRGRSLILRVVLRNLKPQTMYRYRIVRQTAFSRRYGVTRTFTTLRKPATVAPRARNSILWGAQVGSQFTGTDAPWDLGGVTDFANVVGKAPSIVPFNLPFEGCNPGCNYYNFPTQQMDAVNQYGAITMLNWSSMSSPLNTHEPAFTLTKVANGDYDRYIRRFAIAAEQWGHPFLLRFDWEMNGSWFPWAEAANGNTPGSFVAAWRHVHDIFTSVGANNATWVWCPNVDWQHNLTSLSELYPGGSYVDWTCMDGYNFGNLHGNGGWMTFNQIFFSTYKAIVALAPTKPMLIGETASSETGGNKASWITDMFNQLAISYPLIKGLIWFDKAQDNDDWYIESSHASINSFHAGITHPAYTTNTYTNLASPAVTAPQG